MSTNRKDDKKYTLITVIAFIGLITCNVITSFNYLDAVYLLFLISCVVRYIIICKHE